MGSISPPYQNTSDSTTVEVLVPKVTPLPETATSKSVILEPYHVDILPEYGYVSREYLIKGVAAGHPFCTRLLLRCPKDSSRFSGFVVEEPSHLWGGTSIWRHINRWIMRNGTCSLIPRYDERLTCDNRPCLVGGRLTGPIRA